jgi:hypothetical protein
MKTSNSNINMMHPKLKLDGPDGPYARYKDDQVEVLYVNQQCEIVTDSVNPLLNTITCAVGNETNDSFAISIHDPSLNQPLDSVYPAPNSIITIADIEGNFNALYSLLLSHQVINEKFEWTFGNNDLVILGDAVDKGQHVTPCLWLIYHLERQAQLKGGIVHYLLGNHELMNFQLDVRYVPDKYLNLARAISGIDEVTEAYRVLLECNNLLTNWWTSKNCIEKIGDTLFVHGGISPQFLEDELSIEQTNAILHKYLKRESIHPVFAEAVVGDYGPLWYRGLVSEDQKNRVYQKVDETFVDKALEFYGVSRMVIGHTVVEHVSPDFHEKVWRVDVRHAETKFSKASEALLIEDNGLYQLDGSGTRTLFHKSETVFNWRRPVGTAITFLQ